MAFDDHADAEVLNFFAIKVGYGYIAVSRGSTPERWGDIAASVSDLHVLRKGNCIAEGFCTQAMFLFQAGEILPEVHYPVLNVVWFQCFDITS